MQGRPSSVERSDACGGSDDAVLIGMLLDVVQEGGLPCACFAGEEKVAVGVGDKGLEVLFALHA